MAPRFVEVPGGALERGVEFFASSLPAWGVTDAVGLLQQRALHLLEVDRGAEGERERDGGVPAACQHADEAADPERNACIAASLPPKWFSYPRSPPPPRRKSSGGGGDETEDAEDAEDAEGAAGAAGAEGAEGRRQKQSLTRTANAMLAAGAFMGGVYGTVLRRRAKQMHKSVKWKHG